LGTKRLETRHACMRQQVARRRVALQVRGDELLPFIPERRTAMILAFRDALASTNVSRNYNISAYSTVSEGNASGRRVNAVTPTPTPTPTHPPPPPLLGTPAPPLPLPLPFFSGRGHVGPVVLGAAGTNYSASIESVHPCRRLLQTAGSQDVMNVSLVVEVSRERHSAMPASQPLKPFLRANELHDQACMPPDHCGAGSAHALQLLHCCILAAVWGGRIVHGGGGAARCPAVETRDGECAEACALRGFQPGTGTHRRSWRTPCSSTAGWRPPAPRLGCLSPRASWTGP